jgi:hypothetical protein
MSSDQRAIWKPADADTRPVDTRDRRTILLEHLANGMANIPSVLPEGLVPTEDEINDALFALRERKLNYWA